MARVIKENISNRELCGDTDIVCGGEIRIEEAIKMLQDLKKRCKAAGYFQVFIEIWGWEGTRFDVSGKRHERKEEKEKRTSRMQKAKETREKKLRKQYEKLKVKFEPEPEPDVMTNE
jgi:hypothetical protein